MPSIIGFNRQARPANSLCLLLAAASILACNSPSKVQSGRHIIEELNANEISRGKAIIAIAGATIIDGNGGEPIENGCVIVSDGKIAEVGINGVVKIPQDAQVIDGKDLCLLPGFIDAHFHLGDSLLPAMFLQNGVTSVRDPGAWIESYEAARKVGKPIPRLFLSGPHLDTYPPAYPADAFIARDPAEAVTQVNKAADAGSTVIKVYFRLPPLSILEVCKAAHKRGIPVTAHLEITEAMEAIEAGLDGIEHITSFGLSLQPRREAEKYRQMVLGNNDARKQGRYDVWNKLDINGSRADTLVHFLLRKKTFVDPTLGAFEYQMPKSQNEGLRPDSIKWNGFKNMKEFTGKLRKNGVRIVLGSHSMIAYAETGWAYQREMELFAESGLSNSEIIVACTMENARFFRIEDRLGSIEKGKIADLVLLRGNPLKNISDARNVEKVMLNGVWVRE